MIESTCEVETPRPPLNLRVTLPGQLPPRLNAMMGAAVEKMMALDAVNRIYQRAVAAHPRKHFLDRVLDAMNIETLVAAADLERISRRGPVLVVANHPFGGIEGIVLGALLRRLRPDVKLMANFILKAVPDLHDSMIFVDPFDRASSVRTNMGPIKECLRWLRAGGALVVFPAGAVSHLHVRRGGVTDPEWSPTVGRMVLMTGAPVSPVYFHGSNSLLFQVLGLLHPRVRTGLLPRELVNKRNQSLELRIGHLIPFQRLSSLGEARAVMEYLRARTYHLGCRAPSPGHPAGHPARRPAFVPRKRAPWQAEIAPPESPDRLREELSLLPPDRLLLSSGPFEVYVAAARQIPRLLLEIGRLRELTFRGAKEGTGRARDLDRFDDTYLHLFVWNREAGEVVGAYRLGPTDTILREHGVRGLYTSTLFRYRRRLLERIGPALEMGRSFVRAEYQKNYSSLLLLWKGVALFVARHPRYRRLFGPVSISNDYQTMSRHLMVSFLKENYSRPELACWVRARRPARIPPSARLALHPMRRVARDLEEVESLIADMESSLKGVPVLLRQYLRMGGRLLAFNVDPAFSHVIDGLILVDLAETEPALLAKYMGRDACAGFRAHHHLA